MTSLTLLPNALITLTNYTGALTALGDPVDTADASWVLASVGAATSILVVSFPIPPGPLSGAQKFRLRVRKTASGGGSPTLTVKLFEGTTEIGTPINAQAISSLTGVTVEGSWDATGRDPTKIRCYGFATAAGARRIDIGAVEWVANMVDETLGLTGAGGAISGCPYSLPIDQVAAMNWVRANAFPAAGEYAAFASNWRGELWRIAAGA